jgi:hypothetical protein
MNKIKSFEDACQALGLDPSKLPEVSMLPEKHQKSITAFYKLITIAEALNEGWQPDWNDHDQYKYFAWFDVEASEEKCSGSGLSFDDLRWLAHAATYVGSRLCFKTHTVAQYFGVTFIDLFVDYLLTP